MILRAVARSLSPQFFVDLIGPLAVRGVILATLLRGCQCLFFSFAKLLSKVFFACEDWPIRRTLPKPNFRKSPLVQSHLEGFRFASATEECGSISRVHFSSRGFSKEILNFSAGPVFPWFVNISDFQVMEESGVRRRNLN